MAHIPTESRKDKKAVRKWARRLGTDGKGVIKKSDLKYQMPQVPRNFTTKSG